MCIYRVTEPLTLRFFLSRPSSVSPGFSLGAFLLCGITLATSELQNSRLHQSKGALRGFLNTKEKNKLGFPSCFGKKKLPHGASTLRMPISHSCNNALLWKGPTVTYCLTYNFWNIQQDMTLPQIQKRHILNFQHFLLSTHQLFSLIIHIIYYVELIFVNPLV